MSQYEIITTGNEPFTTVNIKKTDKDGKVWFIPTDPANSDYQAYLATLASESAKELTESLPDDPLATADSVSPSPIVP